MDYRVQRAIEDSIRGGRAEHLHARIDSTEWVRYAADLQVACEDWAPAPTDDRREYWGQDEDGDEWRVVLHGDAQEEAETWEGWEGQDRESYTDEQDRESYTVDPDWESEK